MNDFFGTRGAGFWYNVWSGFGSVIVPLMVQALIALMLWYWHNQCHTQGCYNVGKYKNGQWKACRKHLPHDLPTEEDLDATDHGSSA